MKLNKKIYHFVHWLCASQSNTFEIRDALNHVYSQISEHQSLINFLDPLLPLPRLRGSVISPDFANLLVSEIMTKKPKVIFECGGGVSTVISAYCLQKLGTGHITSLDHEVKYASITRKNLADHGVGEFATVYHAPLVNCGQEELPDPWYDLSVLESIPLIDVLVIDGPPGNIELGARYPAIPLLLEHLNDDAIVLLDDAARSGEKAIVDRWLKQFPDFGHEYHSHEKGTVVLRRKEPICNCPCCGKKFQQFIPLPDKWRCSLHVGAKKYSLHDREGADASEIWSCPNCKSNPRTRLYYYFIKNFLENAPGQIDVLHIAPEIQLEPLFRSQSNVNYRTMDLVRDGVDDNCDICDMSIYKTEQFNFLICSHVLEHVSADYRAAIQEIYRVLSYGGKGIVCVPILKSIEKTIEDKSICTDKLRKQAYGDEGHYRIFAKQDLMDGLKQVGFEVIDIYSSQFLDEKGSLVNGISKGTTFILVEKTHD